MTNVNVTDNISMYSINLKETDAIWDQAGTMGTSRPHACNNPVIHSIIHYAYFITPTSKHHHIRCDRAIVSFLSFVAFRAAGRSQWQFVRAQMMNSRFGKVLQFLFSLDLFCLWIGAQKHNQNKVRLREIIGFGTPNNVKPSFAGCKTT